MKRILQSIVPLRSTGLLVGVCLLLAGLHHAKAQSEPPTEVEPYMYVSSYTSSWTVSYPTALEWWQCCAPPNDYGVLVSKDLAWDGTNFTFSGKTIWPTWGTNSDGSAAMTTNSATHTYHLATNGVWSVSWTNADSTVTTIDPFDTPTYLILEREALRKQTNHVTIEWHPGTNDTSVLVTNIFTNSTTLMLYTGKAADTTNAHLFSLTVKVWDTTDLQNETEYSPGNIRVLGQTPDTFGNTNGILYTNFANEARIAVTPAIVGVPAPDTRFSVVPARVKVRFYARAGMMNQGYDPRPGTNDAHWTSLAVGGTNEITELRIPADWATNQVELIVTGPISVSQTNNFSGQTTPLIIISTDTNATTATIEAQYKTNHVTLGVLNVAILRPAIVPIDIWRIQDENSADTAIGGTPSNSEIVQKLDTIFRQACIRFSDVSGESTDFLFNNPYDTNSNSKLDLRGASTEFDSAIQVLLNTAARFRLLIFADWDGSYNDTNVPVNLDHVRGVSFDTYGIAFTKYSAGDISDILAHEIGHLLNFASQAGGDIHDSGIWPVENGSVLEYLMRPGKPYLSNGQWVVPWPGSWLRHEDWESLNREAQ